MLISERQFHILCEEYKLSPMERRIAGLLLDGKTTDGELCDALGKSREMIATATHRILNKSFTRNRVEIILRFWGDSLNIRA